MLTPAEKYERHGLKPGDIALWKPIKWKRGHPDRSWIGGIYVKIVKVCTVIAKVHVRVPDACQEKYGAWWNDRFMYARLADLQPTDLIEFHDVAHPRSILARNTMSGLNNI